jgi:uncharacterized protein
MYYLIIRQFARTLKNLDAILAKAEQSASERKFDVNNLFNARLAPDMLPFAAQIRIACDTAKGAAALLSGKEPPRHEDNETTFEQLRARIGKCLSFLDTVSEADFAKTKADAVIKFSTAAGRELHANDYLIARQIPNFYFHVSMAYALLRQAGVGVGKQDYLGALPFIQS